jgi:miniconductance mechanosensitive channel
MQSLIDWFVSHGLEARTAAVLAGGVAALILLLLAGLAKLITRRILLRLLDRLITRSATTWDDTLRNFRFFNRLAHLAPAIVLHLGAPVAFPDSPRLVAVVQAGAVAYMILVGVMAADALLNAFLSIYQHHDLSRRVPIKVFVQVTKILVIFVAAIMVLSVVLDRSPLVFFSGLGAITAVLLLIFKDSILGFVAGIQLSGNDMVRRGDWIQMDRYGADGDVIDVALTTVKVQNWDKTITTIPTYALISDSFKNWRGMQEAGGRRIKRAINMDMTSVRFCDEDMLERFRRFQHIKGYLDAKLEELRRWNAEHSIDERELINGRRLTNLGTFRAYVEAYLRQHARLRQNMTLMVRHLPPGPTGIPIEIYCFSSTTDWVEYEGVQADIFDHLLAVVPLFDLRVFQQPTGEDVTRVADRLAEGSARP